VLFFDQQGAVFHAIGGTGTSEWRRTLMETSASDVKDLLLRESEEFQQLSRRHQELDERLTALTAKYFLSEEEKLEETTLKKRKLAIKDRMAHMIRAH
jgi:uncharacterized protein YdcH (DUF465 family)